MKKMVGTDLGKNKTQTNLKQINNSQNDCQ